MKNCRILFVCLACLSHLTCLAIYTGHVYVDKNSSGSFDKEDTPIQGVVVTDGQNTVKTGKDGRFTLPGYERTHFITVTTPAGYRIDKPYIPVNAGIRSYDFALSPSAETAQNDHSFLHITDTEIHNRGVDTHWVNYLKQYITSEQPAFLIHTGDICYESGLKAHIQVVNGNTMGCPVYYCIGNHDLVKGEYGEQLFESIYGPSWYSFDAGNIHYVVTPMGGGDYRPGYTRKEIYTWLKNDLAMKDPGKQLVIFNHDILTATDDFFFGVSDTERIDLREYNLKAWIYGHWHINYVRDQNGIYTVCTATLDKGGIDHSPSAFRVFRMKKDKVENMNLHYCFLNHQAVIAVPADGTTAPLTADRHIPLSVNAYHSGSEVKQVTYARREGERFGAPQPMIRRSDWNWSAEMTRPEACTTTGEIELEVTAVFTDGKTVVSHSRFWYNPSFIPEIRLGQDWTNLLGNVAHTGKTGDTLRQPLQLAWTHNLGATVFMASPLIADGRVFIASTDDNNRINQGVYALDAHTGKQLWKYPVRNSVKNSIAYDRQTVFAQDADGWLYAIEASTGRLKWERRMNTGTSPYLEDGLVAENGLVYAGTAKGLGAYRETDGVPLWTNNAGEKGEGTTTTLTVAGNVLTAGSQWKALYGHNVQTGELLWKLSEEGLSDRGASTTFHDGLFYVISRNSLFIIEPETGKIVTQKKLSEFNLNVTSTPLITETEIIFGSADKGLIALDKPSLSIKWTTPVRQSLVYTSPYVTTPAGSIETSPVLSDGIIYFGASDGCLYGVKADTGDVVWKMCTGAPVLASVAVSGNMLVAADFAGNVYAFAGK